MVNVLCGSQLQPLQKRMRFNKAMVKHFDGIWCFFPIRCVFSIPVVRLWDKTKTHDSLKIKTIFIVWFCETRSNLPLSVFFDFWISRLNIIILSIWVRPLMVKIPHKTHYRTTNRKERNEKKNENEIYSNKRKFIWLLLVLKKNESCLLEKNITSFVCCDL